MKILIASPLVFAAFLVFFNSTKENEKAQELANAQMRQTWDERTEQAGTPTETRIIRYLREEVIAGRCDPQVSIIRGVGVKVDTQVQEAVQHSQACEDRILNKWADHLATQIDKETTLTVVENILGKD